MQEGNKEHVTGPEVPQCMDRPGDDDMAEGDLGDGMVKRPDHITSKNLQSRSGSRGHVMELLPGTGILNRGSEVGEAAFSWTSCSGMYTAFRQELEEEPSVTRWRIRKSESLNDLSNEELRERLHELTEEAELLRCELEVTSRHLEGKHEALKILQGQVILKRATSHTHILLQKSEERTKALEKEVNALQWEITYNQMQFKNFEQFWEQRYSRFCSENKALSDSLGDRVKEVQELRAENAALSQECLELLAMLNIREQRAFQGTKPSSSQGPGDQRTVLELAVLGACQCPNVKEACPCARTAAASRKQVLQLKQELEAYGRRREEAMLMADAFRIAFEQQLKRRSDHFLQLAESDRHKSRPRRPEGQNKTSSLSVAQRLRGLLPSGTDITDDPTETLHKLLDLLSDKEEALAHQRKVSFMLAHNTEELEKRLQTDYTRQTKNTPLDAKSNHAETSCCSFNHVQGMAGEDQCHHGTSSEAPDLSLLDVQDAKTEDHDLQIQVSSP